MQNTRLRDSNTRLRADLTKAEALLKRCMDDEASKQADRHALHDARVADDRAQLEARQALPCA